MLDGIQFLLFIAGLVFSLSGISRTVQSKTDVPPLPVGWVFGVLLSVLGSSGVFGSLLVILSLQRRVLYYMVVVVFGAFMVYMGFNSIETHPIEFPVCPCPQHHYGEDCTPCLGVDANSPILNICNGHGACDDTLNGTGVCFCEFNWKGSDECDICTEHFDGAECEKCDRGWTGLECDSCYPGYIGKECNMCSDGWLAEYDSIGILCRKCLPDHYGPFCTKCDACTTHDSLAFCRDNDWHDTNLYDSNICSPTANACNDDYDCASSYNCKGKCVNGALTNEILCTTDLDCVGFGKCEFKSCCAESKFGDGHCECQRVGYFGPKCEPCPGFDNVYTSSICGGHGTCQTSYVKGEYKELICNCNFEEEGFWSGPECGCFKETVDGDCVNCANGFFGPNCDMCPGGGGVSQCSLHGECSDGLEGSGTCSCDLDTKRNGLGAWSGDSCSTCLSSDFYGGMCQTCPLFTFIGCDGHLTPFGDTGNCMTSCGTKTCSDDGVCITCNAGKFMNSQRRCEECHPGSVSIDGTGCITCVEGKYQSEAGKTICIDCPSGRSTDGSRGAASCGICQQGEYSNSGDPSCTTCPRGRFNPLVEQEKCENCTVGMYSNVTGQHYVTTCKDCPTGKFTYTEGTPECIWCDLHAVQDVTGQTDCVKCRAGQMVYPILIMEGANDDSINETECENIYDYWELRTTYETVTWAVDKPAGCFKSNVNVYFNLNNYSLVNCSDSNKCIQKPNHCLNCSAHWSSISGEFCRECPGGQFTEAGGLCKECAPGKFAKDTGDGCVDCALGTYNTEGGLHVCQDCPYGKTTASEGNILQTSCVNCPSGKMSHKYVYRGLASCNSDSSNRLLVYEGMDENGDNDNPGEDEAAQAKACYTRCKSYRLHTLYDEPTPPPEILTQEQCYNYTQDHHLTWAGDDYASADYPKGCFIWQNGMHYNLNNFSTGNCNFNSAKCVILPSLMYSKAYNVTAFTLNVLSQPGRCYCELDTYEECTSKLEGYLEREWKYFNLDFTESVLCKDCILGTNSIAGSSYCDSCNAGSYGTINFVAVDSGGYNDNSVSREECRQLSIQENRDGWSVLSQADRPVGCYRSGNQWRYNYNGELECGAGTDVCIQKVTVSCESCLIGQYEDRVHSDHCKNCPDGQYQNKTGQDKCEAWHLCVSGEEETSVPTKDTDRDCAQCPAGKASDVIYYQTPENCQQENLAILNREECLTAYNNAPYRTGLKGNRSLFHCYDGVGGPCGESYEVHWNGTITDLSHSTIYGTTWEDYSEHTYESWQQFCSAWPNNNNVFNGGLGGCTTPVPMLRVPLNRDVGYGIQSNGCVFSQQYDQQYFGPSLLLNRNDYGWDMGITNVHGGDAFAYDCSHSWSRYNFQYSCGSKYFCRLYESCQECPAGTYTDLEGSSECLKCADGTSSLSGDTVCSICEAGTSSTKIWNENDEIVYNMTQQLIFQDQEPLKNVGSSARCKERCDDAFIFDHEDGCRCSLEKPTWGRFRRRMLLELDVTNVDAHSIKVAGEWENLLSCTEYANIATQPKYECVLNQLYSVTYDLTNFPWQLFYPKMTSLIQECKAIYDADTRTDKYWNGKTHNPWMPPGCAAVNPDHRGIMHYEFNTHVGPKYRNCGDRYYNTPIECYYTGETFYSWDKDETTGCTNCGEGTFSEEEATECTSCSQGRYRDGQSCEEYANANGYTYLTWEGVLSSSHATWNCETWAKGAECNGNPGYMWGNCKKMCLMHGSPEGCVRRGGLVWFNRQKTTRQCGYASVQCVEAGCKACPPSTISTSRDGCCDVTFTKENYLQTTFTVTTFKADSLDQVEFTGGHVQGTYWVSGGPIAYVFKRLDVNGNAISNKRLLCSSHGVALEIEIQINADKYIELKQTGARAGFACSTGNATSVNYDWNNAVGLNVPYGGGNGYSIYTLTGKLCGACHLNYMDSDKSTFCSMCPINTFHSQGKCEFCPEHKHNNLTYIDIPSTTGEMGQLQIYLKSQVSTTLSGSQKIYINDQLKYTAPSVTNGAIVSRLKYNRGWEMEDSLTVGSATDYFNFLNAFQHGDMLVLTTVNSYNTEFSTWANVVRDEFGSIYVDEIDSLTPPWMFVGIKGEAPILELFDTIDIEKNIKIDRGYCDSCPVGTDSTATSDCFATHPGERHDLDVTYSKGNVALSPAADKITIRIASVKSNTLLVYDGTSSVAPITGDSGIKLARLRRENFTWVYDDHLDSSIQDSLHAFVWNTKDNQMLIYAQLGETTFHEKTLDHLEFHYGITIPESDSTTTDDNEFSFVAIKGLSQPLHTGRAQWIQFQKTKTTLFSACLEGTYQDERKQVVCKECEAGKGAVSTPVITWSSPTIYSYTGGEGYIHWQENYGTVDQCAQDCYDQGYLFGGLYHQQTYRECRCCKKQFGCNYQAVNTLHLTQMKGYGRIAETDACETCAVAKVSNGLACEPCGVGRYSNNQGKPLFTVNDGGQMNDYSLTKDECRQWATDNDYPLFSGFDNNYVWEGGAYGCWLYQNGLVYWNTVGEGTCAGGWQYCVQKTCRITPIGFYTKSDNTGMTSCDVGSYYDYGLDRVGSPDSNKITVIVGSNTNPHKIWIGDAVKLDDNLSANGGAVATRFKMNNAGAWEFYRTMKCEYDTFTYVTSGNTMLTISEDECQSWASSAGKTWSGLKNDLSHPPGCFLYDNNEAGYNEGGWDDFGNTQYRLCGYSSIQCIERICGTQDNFEAFIRQTRPNELLVLSSLKYLKISSTTRTFLETNFNTDPPKERWPGSVALEPYSLIGVYGKQPIFDGEGQGIARFRTTWKNDETNPCVNCEHGQYQTALAQVGCTWCGDRYSARGYFQKTWGLPSSDTMLTSTECLKYATSLGKTMSSAPNTWPFGCLLINKDSIHYNSNTASGGSCNSVTMCIVKSSTANALKSSKEIGCAGCLNGAEGSTLGCSFCASNNQLLYYTESREAVANTDLTLNYEKCKELIFTVEDSWISGHEYNSASHPSGCVKQYSISNLRYLIYWNTATTNVLCSTLPSSESCIQANFEFADGGTLPDKSVATAAECQRAAAVMGYGWGSSGSWIYHPQGCFLDVDNFYWNSQTSRDVECVNSWERPYNRLTNICVQIPKTCKNCAGGKYRSYNLQPSCINCGVDQYSRPGLSCSTCGANKVNPLDGQNKWKFKVKGYPKKDVSYSDCASFANDIPGSSFHEISTDLEPPGCTFSLSNNYTYYNTKNNQRDCGATNLCIEHTCTDCEKGSRKDGSETFEYIFSERGLPALSVTEKECYQWAVDNSYSYYDGRYAHPAEPTGCWLYDGNKVYYNVKSTPATCSSSFKCIEKKNVCTFCAVGKYHNMNIQPTNQTLTPVAGKFTVEFNSYSGNHYYTNPIKLWNDTNSVVSGNSAGGWVAVRLRYSNQWEFHSVNVSGFLWQNTGRALQTKAYLEEFEDGDMLILGHGEVAHHSHIYNVLTTNFGAQLITNEGYSWKPYHLVAIKGVGVIHEEYLESGVSTSPLRRHLPYLQLDKVTPAWTCENCPSGYYQDQEGQVGCKACDLGKYHIHNDATPGSALASHCQWCPAGKYQNRRGQNFCWECDPGHTTNGASGWTLCTACPVGKYQSYYLDSTAEDNTVSKEECLAVKNSNGLTVNTNSAFEVDELNAPFGCYTVHNGAEISSEQVFWNDLKDSSWTTGVYYSIKELTNCFNCGTSTYQGETGQTTCKNCAAGTSSAPWSSTGYIYQETGEYDRWQENYATVSICSLKCAERGYPFGGMYWAPSGTWRDCRCCKTQYGCGYTTSNDNSGVMMHVTVGCSKCLAGTYADYYPSQSGSPDNLISEQECKALNGVFPQSVSTADADFFIHRTDIAFGCLISYWHAGSYWDWQYNIKFNRYRSDRPCSQTAGVTCIKRHRTCQNCTAGKYSTAGLAECLDCPLGSVTDVGGTYAATSCTQCGAGKYSGANLLTTGYNDFSVSVADCSILPNWKTTDNPDKVTRSDRAYGCVEDTQNEELMYYSNPSLHLMNRECSSSYPCYQQDPNCQDCPVGKYSGTVGGTWHGVCNNCPAGKKLNTIGATSIDQCQTCAAGTASAAGSSSCTVCGPGTFSGEGAGSCTTCAAETFQTAGGQSACFACAVACGVGHYESTACTATSNRVCTYCENGKFAYTFGAGFVSISTTTTFSYANMHVPTSTGLGAITINGVPEKTTITSIVKTAGHNSVSYSTGINRWFSISGHTTFNKVILDGKRSITSNSQRAIFINNNYARLTMTDCIIKNFQFADGPAIRIENVQDYVHLTNTQILYNVATANYGAIMDTSQKEVKCTGCIFEENTSPNHGSAWDKYIGTTIFEDCDFIKNTNANTGDTSGAIRQFKGSLKMTNVRFRENTPHALAIYDGTDNQPTLDFTDVFLLKDELCDPGEYGYLKWHDGWNDEFMDQYQQDQVCQKCDMGKHANYIKYRDTTRGNGCGEGATIPLTECANAAFEFGYYDIHEITSGRPDLSMSLTECKAYHDANYNNWGELSLTNRPKGCYKSGSAIRWSHTGTLDCGMGTDNCLEKRPKTPTYDTQTHAPHGCFMDGSTLYYFDNGLYFDRSYTAPYYFCYEGTTREDSCEECTVGKFSTTVGAASASTCDTCEAGKFSDQPGAVTCKDCPTGFRSARNFEYYTTTAGVTSFDYLTRQECQDFANQINKPYNVVASGTEPRGCYQRFYNGDTGQIRYNPGGYVCSGYCVNAGGSFPIVKKQPIHNPPTNNNCTYCASNRYSLAEGSSACIDCPTNRVVEYPMFISITTQSTLSWDQANEFMVSKEDCLEADAQFEAMGLGGTYGAGNLMSTMEGSWSTLPYGCTYYTDIGNPYYTRVLFNTHASPVEFNHVDSSGGSYNNRICMVGMEVEKSYVVLESEELRCDDIDDVYQVTKEECQDAKNTLGLDGSIGGYFEETDPTAQTQLPSGCSYYLDPDNTNNKRVLWNPGTNGQDNIKDTKTSACTDTNSWCYRSYNRRVCKTHDVEKKRFKILESTSQKCSDILRLPTSQELIDSSISMPGLDRWVPTVNSNLSYAFNALGGHFEKDYIQIGDLNHYRGKSHVSDLGSFPSWDTSSTVYAFRVLVLLPVPCDGCAAGTYSTVGESTCKECPMGKTNAANMYTCLNCFAGQYSALGEDKCTICPSSDVSLVFHYFEGESDNTVTEDECSKMGPYDGTTTAAARPTGCYIYTANGHFIYNLDTSGAACSSTAGCVGRSRNKYEVLTNGYPILPASCESLADDLGKGWNGTGSGTNIYPGCTVQGGNMAYYENSATQESDEKHIVGYEFVRTGECGGGEQNAYPVADNPCTGDGFDCIEKCYKECKRRNDNGIYPNKGFIVHDADASGSSNGNVGGCYCESASGRDCTPENDEWDRFDYIYKGFKPDNAFAAVSKTCGTTCPTGSFKYGTVCAPCQPGNYCPGDNSIVSCPAGTFSSGYNATVCQSCAPGKTSSGGAAVCSNCAQGKYSGYKLVHDGRPDKSIGYHLCKSYGGTSEAESWFPAKGFEEVNDANKPQGCYVDMTASDTKVRWNKNFGNKVCSPMFPCVQRMTTCENCPAGRYQSNHGGDSCSKIPDGSYAHTSTGSVGGYAPCSTGTYRKMWRKVVDGNSNDATVTYDDCKAVATELGFDFYEFTTSGKIDYGGTIPSQNLPMHSCGGDCDVDADCAGNMKCFQTNTGIVPAGCNSGMSATYDWCYTPSETLITHQYNDGNTNIPLCGGDCDNDSDCAGDYVCFQRVGTEAVPGCAGSTANGYDYCVSPQTYTTSGLKQPAVVGTFDSSLFVSPKGCFMHKGLTTRLYYNVQDSPAACTEDRPCVQYTTTCETCGSGKYGVEFFATAATTKTQCEQYATSNGFSFGVPYLILHNIWAVGTRTYYTLSVTEKKWSDGGSYRAADCGTTFFVTTHGGCGGAGYEYVSKASTKTKYGVDTGRTFSSTTDPLGCFLHNGHVYYNEATSTSASAPVHEYSGSCFNCAAGEISTAGSGSCTDCGAGTYDSEDWGRNYVASTNPSTTWNGLGAGNGLSYDDCKIYAAQNGLTFHEFYTSSGGIYGCFKETGHVYYNPAGNRDATSSSTYQLISYYDVCTSCPVGKAQGTLGSTDCDICGAGYYQDVVGQVGCKQCAAGQYQDQSEQTGCKICGYGEYQDSGGQSGCKVCPAGKYRAVASLASHCKDCPEGRYSNPINLESTVPTGDTVDETMTQAECTELYNAQTGNKNNYCLTTNRCGTGRPRGCSRLLVQGQWYFYHTNIAGLATCPSSYTCYKKEASRSCEACPNGKTAAPGSTSCTLCPENTYTPHSINAVGMTNVDYHLSVDEAHCRSLATSSTNYQTTGSPDLSLNEQECYNYASANGINYYDATSASYTHPTETKGCFYYPSNQKIYYNIYNGDSNAGCSSTFQCVQGISYNPTNDCPYGCFVSGTQGTSGSDWVSWCGTKHATNTYSTFTNKRLVVASLTCVACPKGKLANAERTECVPCPAGKVSISGTCNQCASGKYAAEINVQSNTSSFTLDTVNKADCETYANEYGDSFDIGVWDAYPYGCRGQYEAGHINKFYWNEKLPKVEFYSGGHTKSIEYALSLDACKRIVNHLRARDNIDYTFAGAESATSYAYGCVRLLSTEIWFNYNTESTSVCDSASPCIYYHNDDRHTSNTVALQYSNKCIGCQPGKEAKSDGTGCDDCGTGEYSMEFIVSSEDCEEAHNQLKDDTGAYLFSGYAYLPGQMNKVNRRDLPRGCQYISGHGVHGIIFNEYKTTDMHTWTDPEDLFQVNTNVGSLSTVNDASVDTRYGVINIDGVVEGNLFTNGEAQWTIQQMTSLRVCPLYDQYDHPIKYQIKYTLGEQCRTTSTCKACPAGMYLFQIDYTQNNQHFDGNSYWNVQQGNTEYKSIDNSLSYSVAECKAWATANGLTFHILSDASYTTGCGRHGTSFIYYNLVNAWKWDSNTQLSLIHWSRCIVCQPGKYQPSTGSTSCVDCPTGQYQDKQGQSSCTNCPAGRYQNEDGKGSCTICLAGQYAPGTTTLCTDCPAGQYQNQAGQGACNDCLAGTYSTGGTSSCTACPAGKGVASSGSTSSSSCQDCAAGMHSLDYTIRYHQDAAPNTLSVDITECQNLASAAGYSFSAGCNRNYYFPGGCSKNTPGTYFEYNICSGQWCNIDSWFHCVSKNYPDERICYNCPAGQYQDSTGQSSCKDCAAHHWATEGSTSCTSCNVGQYVSAISASSGTCQGCPAGKYQNQNGQNGCKSCPAGQYQNQNAQSSCKSCANYNSRKGATTWRTGDRYHVSSAGSSSCYACSGCQVANSDFSACVDGPSYWFQEAFGYEANGPLEENIYEGNTGDNPCTGNHADCIQRCFNSCLGKGYFGFIVRTDGRCWCETSGGYYAIIHGYCTASTNYRMMSVVKCGSGGSSRPNQYYRPYGDMATATNNCRL